MALFGKKATDPIATSVPSPAPIDGQGQEFATDVFGLDDPSHSASASAGKKKTAKARGPKNGVVVGLNIGNSLIKAVEVTSKNGEISVTGIGCMITPPDCYSNGNILNVSALSNALKSLWKLSGFKAKSAILSVAGAGSLVVRVIEVPKMTDSELSDNMKVDADRYIPFPPSEVIMDFKALRDLPSDPDAPNMEVLLAAAHREVIDLHVKIIQTAKIAPVGIDVEPLAAARAVNLERTLKGIEPDYSEVTALVNLGARGTEISVLRGDVVVFTRSLPNGGDSLTTAIAENFGISLVEAETQKKRLANALAPAGYAAEGDDFADFSSGFGDTSTLGNDVFRKQAASSSSPFDTFNSIDQTASASNDPFDMDFFNQGPKNEPGSGHSQKEDESTPSDPPAFTFSFGDNSSAPLTPDTPPKPPASSSEPLTPTDQALSLSSAFDFSDLDLPSVAQTEVDQQGTPATPSIKKESRGNGVDLSLPEVTEVNESTSAPEITSPALVNETSPSLASKPYQLSVSDTENRTSPTDIAPQNLDSQVIDKEEPARASGIDVFALSESADSASHMEAPAAQVDQILVSGLGVDEIDLEGSGVFHANDSFADDITSFGAGLGEVGVDADANALFSAIAPTLEELSTEVRRSLEYHLGRFPDTTFSRIYLVGGGADLANLDQFFTDSLGVPTQVINPLRFVKMQIPEKGDEEIEALIAQLGPTCATALGLAMRDFVS